MARLTQRGFCVLMYALPGELTQTELASASTSIMCRGVPGGHSSPLATRRGT